MKFTAQQIAALLQGTIEGDANAAVSNLSRIEEGAPGTLSFLANPLYTPYLYTTNATIVIVRKDLVLTGAVASTLIRVESPENSFAQLLEMYNQVKLKKAEISPKGHIAETAKIGANLYLGEFAVIGDNVTIGDNVKIYPQAYIGDNSVIGNNTIIYAGVKIYSDTKIGANCILHSGAVLGSDGFRFALGNDHKKVPQIGNVIIEDDVEIGANTTIDRATLGSTILRKGVKLDNLVHIAHNVEVGSHTYMAASVIIAGSTKIGKNCLIAGQVGIVGHIEIADNTILSAQCGISKSITEPGQIYLGSPALEHTKFKKAFIHFKNFESIVKRITKLEANQK